MGKDDGAATPWRVQWHVAADGTVIRQRSRGDQEHEQLFQTFATTRPVTVAELDSLSGRSEHEMRRANRFGVVWLLGGLVYYAGFAVVGALVLRSVSGNSDDLVPGVIVGLVAAALLTWPVLRLVAAFLPKDDVGSIERLWRDAGLASSTGVTMSGADARALIQAPGCTSGARTQVERA